jgi:FtsZ-interacting cell division protein ZipA
MSRRAIVVVVASIGAIIIANIVVLAFWPPRRTNSSAKVEQVNPATASVQGPAQSAASGTVSPARGSAPGPSAIEQPAGFAVERQVVSASGNLRIKYLRDRKTKLRRITVEDARRPEMSTVLCESKHTAWAVVSPDDQWIAIDERTGADGGGARLYHRNGTSIRYDPAKDGPDLQDAIWKVYLSAAHGDLNTPRRGVTIDATAWENDSRKLDISVAYLPSTNQPDVPEPWSCTYDVVTQHVEPAPDQPTADLENADAQPPDQNVAQPDAAQEQVAQQDGDNEQADTELPGEKFPATREEELAVPDVNESSLSDITYAINEMFARHGAEFKDKKVTKEFSQFPWYQPRPGVTYDQIEKEFSDLEKENLKVLSRCRDAKLAAAHRKPRPVRGEEPTSEQIMRGILQGIGNGLPGD